MMDWQEKLAALQSLTDTCLIMRKPGDWYVSAPGRSIGGDGCLTGAYGNGKLPHEAVEADWQKMTNLPPEKYIQVDGKKFRWTGYMWKELP